MAKATWRNTNAYRRWRVAVIRRDKSCRACGSLKNRHAHHIEHATYNKALRFDPDNGVVLCGDCHRVIHTKIAKTYRKNCGFKELKALLYIAKLYMKKGERT